MCNLIKFPETFKIDKNDINTGKATKHVYDIKKFYGKGKKRGKRNYLYFHAD